MNCRDQIVYFRFIWRTSCSTTWTASSPTPAKRWRYLPPPKTMTGTSTSNSSCDNNNNNNNQRTTLIRSLRPRPQQREERPEVVGCCRRFRISWRRRLFREDETTLRSQHSYLRSNLHRRRSLRPLHLKRGCALFYPVPVVIVKRWRQLQQRLQRAYRHSYHWTGLGVLSIFHRVIIRLALVFCQKSKRNIISITRHWWSINNVACCKKIRVKIIQIDPSVTGRPMFLQEKTLSPVTKQFSRQINHFRSKFDTFVNNLLTSDTEASIFQTET